VDVVHVDPAADVAVRAGLLGDRLVADGADVVVVSGSARFAAAVVTGLQGTGFGVPVVLSPQATCPVFPALLSSAGASLVGSFFSVGIDNDDPQALLPNETGRAMSAFLAADRAAAADPGAVSLLGDQPFSKVAGLADVSSHDAVMALAAAAGKAGATTPGALMAVLTGLSLDHGAGLAGPPLSFAGPDAVDGTQVVVLHASTANTGLRPDSGGAGDVVFTWFAVSTSTS